MELRLYSSRITPVNVSELVPLLPLLFVIGSHIYIQDLATATGLMATTFIRTTEGRHAKSVEDIWVGST
jgi:hypothetical protein